MSHRMTETTSPCHLGTWETGHPQEDLEMTWEVENWLQHWMQPSHTWPKVEGSLIGSMCLSNTSARVIGRSLSCAANTWRSWVQNPATASWICFLFSLHLCLTKSPQSKFCLRLALCTLLTSHSTPKISPGNLNSPKSDTTEYKRASSLTLPLATRCPQVKPNWSLNWKKKNHKLLKKYKTSESANMVHTENWESNIQRNSRILLLPAVLPFKMPFVENIYHSLPFSLCKMKKLRNAKLHCFKKSCHRASPLFHAILWRHYWCSTRLME